MPIVTVKLMEGRTPEQKKALSKKITEALCEEVNAKAESITIVIEDMKTEDYYKGDML